jgi:PAS domain-containing protein
MSNPRCDSELDRLRLALSSAEMGTWDLDLPTGVFWWDERMHALFGLAPGAFKGSYEDFLGLIHEEDRERIRIEFTRTMAERAAVDTEFQVAWPSHGSKHVVRMRSRVHSDDNSEISRIVGSSLGHHRASPNRTGFGQRAQFADYVDG